MVGLGADHLPASRDTEAEARPQAVEEQAAKTTAMEADAKETSA